MHHSCRTTRMLEEYCSETYAMTVCCNVSVISIRSHSPLKRSNTGAVSPQSNQKETRNLHGHTSVTDAPTAGSHLPTQRSQRSQPSAAASHFWTVKEGVIV